MPVLISRTLNLFVHILKSKIIANSAQDFQINIVQYVISSPSAH